MCALCILVCVGTSLPVQVFVMACMFECAYGRGGATVYSCVRLSGVCVYICVLHERSASVTATLLWCFDEPDGSRQL